MMNEMAIQPKISRDGLALTLRDVVAPVFRKRQMATLLFLGIFLGAILAMLLLPRKYEAEMKLLVNRERVDAVVTPNPDSPVAAAPVPVINEEDLNSEVELLKSRDLLEKVVLICGLESQEKSAWERALERAEEWMRGTPTTGEARLARSVQMLENRLVVDPLKKTTLIRVSYTARDPELAARVLQTLAIRYQEKHATVHRLAGTFTFFDQETDHYRNELVIAEAQLTQFNSEEGIVSASAQKQLVLQQLSQFEAELQQAQANATEARERALALKTQARATPDRQTTQMKKVDNAQLFAQLEGTLLSLELRRSEMLMKYAPSYPPVQEVENQIAETRAAIARAGKSPVEEVITDRPPAQDWMATELAKAETDGAALEAQAIETARIVRHYRDTAQNLDRKGMEQDDLARNVKTWEENYLLYLRKREEARISDALDRKRIVNVSIAEAATIPALPTLHLAWVLIGGFFAAGIVSVGSAYAVDRLDPSFRTPDELSRYLDMKVLASIPENVKKQ
jgi:uncharacterized protein involved in exopolysaccharide biosynthesis